MSEADAIIAVPPKCYRFSEREEGRDAAELERILRAQDATEPVEINKPKDAMLDSTGRVQRRFRFTTTGLSQLCSALAPGLAQLASNVAGLRRKDTETDEWKVYDPALAIHQINDLIRLRFKERLEGHGLIMDRRSLSVEGVVGPRYKFLSNLELFEQAREFAREQESMPRFFEATLEGRRVVIRYRDAERLFSLPAAQQKREPFYRGWHFSNSEIGDCSIRTGMLIVRQWRRTSSLLDIGRLVHLKGGEFGPKIGELFQKLRVQANAEAQENDYESLAADMQAESLQLGGDPVAHVRRAQSLVGRLSRGRLSKIAAKRAVNHALANGSYRGDRVEGGRVPTYDAPDEDLLGVFRQRNVYDLYNALTTIARESPPEQQEVAEEQAYRILVQRFRLHN